MAYELQAGETARHAAQAMLGDGNLYHDLHASGWDGNPDNVQVGMKFYLKGEKEGPPARHMLDPKHWGKGAR